jgi:hypothetical protein
MPAKERVKESHFGFGGDVSSALKSLWFGLR